MFIHLHTCQESHLSISLSSLSVRLWNLFLDAIGINLPPFTPRDNSFQKNEIRAMRLVFLIGPQYLIVMWFRRIEEQTLQRHMFITDCTISPNIINYPTLTSEHNWEGLCIHQGKKSTNMRIQ